MKKLTTLAVAIAILAMPALANTGKEKKLNSRESVTIKQTGNEQFDLQVNADAPGKVNVKVYSERGKLLHQNNYAYKQSFKVPFDLSSLEQGNYRFVVEGSDIEVNQEVFVSKLHEEDVAVFVQSLDENKVRVTVFRDDTSVKLSIVDEGGRKLFEERLLGQHNFTQLFDLSEVNSKELQMVVEGRKSTVRKIL